MMGAKAMDKFKNLSTPTPQAECPFSLEGCLAGGVTGAGDVGEQRTAPADEADNVLEILQQYDGATKH